MSSKIFVPKQNDILLGRGKFAMTWHGNVFFRELVLDSKERYDKGDNKVKKEIAQSILNEINALSPPGRFLKQMKSEWIEVGRDVAIKKTRQALRENIKGLINRVGAVGR